MRTRKRAASQANNNAQLAKKGRSNDGDSRASGPEKSDKENEYEGPKHAPYEYICIDIPHSFLRSDECNDDGDDDKNEPRENIHGKLAKENPEWKWTMMWKSWEYMCDWVRESSYTNPDNFHMYVYNDFHGYGVLGLVERQLVNFNREYVKKVPAVHAMWAIISMLGHWLSHGDVTGIWMAVDDGDRVSHIYDVIGCALLTSLDLVDRSGQLKPASKFPDLALVMSLYLYLALDLEDYGIDKAHLEWWRKNIVGYAKKGGLDLDANGCGKINEELQRLSGTMPLKGIAKAGRWQWPRRFKEQKQKWGMDEGPTKGGDSFNILKWTREQRAEHTFDKKDPLDDKIVEQLKKGAVLLVGRD